MEFVIKISDSEFQYSSKVRDCSDVTTQHWKFWLEKYKEVISK